MIEYIEVEGIGTVRVQRRKGTRTIRISLSQNGEVRLSLPPRLPLSEGVKFLKSKQNWVDKHAGTPSILEDGARIGKAHTLKVGVSFSSKVQVSYGQSIVVVHVPKTITQDAMQQKLEATAKKILQKEAEALLPQRLQQLAQAHNFNYNSCSISHAKSKWGSCSTKNDIILNAFLIQLPWELIDYVIVHELAHTKQHNHSDAFWQVVASVLPDYKRRKQMLKKFPTSVFDTREIADRMA